MPSKPWIAVCNIALSFIMSVILAICFTVGMGQSVTLQGFAFTFLASFLSALVVSFVVPLPRIGSWYASKMGFERGSGAGYIAESVIEVTLFLVIMNIPMVAAMTGFGELGGMTFFDRWWSMNMNFWPVAFIAFMVSRTLSEAIATKATAGRKAEAPAREAA